MVKLRLKRAGSKFNAFYRIVAADSRAPRDGKYIEEIGFYNPHSKEIKINLEAKDKWLKEGAMPSETVKKLFSKAMSVKLQSNVVSTLPKKVKKVKKITPQVVVSTKENITAKEEEKVETEQKPSDVLKEEASSKPEVSETTKEENKSTEEVKTSSEEKSADNLEKSTQEEPKAE